MLAGISIRTDHLYRADAERRRIIEDDRLHCHSSVIGELALGSLRDRGSAIACLSAQRIPVVVTHGEVMTIIDRHGSLLNEKALGPRSAGLVRTLPVGSPACSNEWSRQRWFARQVLPMVVVDCGRSPGKRPRVNVGPHRG